jgi:hypothetical protein
MAPKTSFAKRVLAEQDKDSRDRAELEDSDSDHLPQDSNKYWVVDPTRERTTFRERILAQGKRQESEHPQAFWDNDSDYDVIDLTDGHLHNAPDDKWWHPAPAWSPPKGPGPWSDDDLPTTRQLTERAANPYQTDLSADERGLYDEFNEKHPDLGENEDDPDRPSFDYPGWWNATQRPGAAGPESKLPLSHWETPHSPTFARNTDSKYAIPPPPPNTLPAIVDRAAHPYKTPLNPNEEREFHQWVGVSKAPFRDAPDDDYDMRGYWKALRSGDPRATTAAAPDGTTHYPDTWKTPMHRTFSDESIYAQPGAPSWHGDVLVSPKGDIVSDERGIIEKPRSPTAGPVAAQLGAPYVDPTKLPPPAEAGDK